LVQLEEFETPDGIFNNYAYFSSYSDSWLAHSHAYAIQMIQQLGLTSQSQVIELASNDGYLLQYFQQYDIPVLGVEPAANVAAVAENKGIPTWVRFFGKQTAKDLIEKGIQADLLIGNNVLAHVPDINDFVGGMKHILKPNGTITMEFPHLLQLIANTQFDTIYHEHFSYFSFHTVEQIFKAHRLMLVDVEELPTHGGSLRIYAKHIDCREKVGDRVLTLKQKEIDAGLHHLDAYLSFSTHVNTIKRNLLKFLIKAKEQGKLIVGYGAPAKGNTLLNYCGIRTDFLDFTVDRSPHKQGTFLPGTQIPVYSPERIAEVKPDYVLILPWNIKDEIIGQMSHIQSWGGKFVVPIPQLEVIG
jgi:2-polyprenyl-3-methyl-5-hydroxy-6-metoxy-1,4-benzoquinol methylase